MELRERFMARVREVGDCWEFQGSDTGNGYRFIYVEGRNKLAHRVSYEMAVGPIPEGLTIDHLCRNRACVKPEHLEAVTLTENILRGTGPTAENVTKTACPKGHEYTPENTRLYRGKRYCRECHRIRTRIYDRTKRVRKSRAKGAA